MDRKSERQTAPTNFGAVEVTLPGDRQIVITRSFDAPRAIVFEAWTRAEHVTHWWDPAGLPLLICEIDLRPGGAFRFINRAPDGSPGPSFSGVYQEITPPEKLVFGMPPGTGSSTLIFAEEGQGTRLTITIECATSEERDFLLQMRVDAGTAQTLNNLAAYLPTLTGGEAASS